MKPQIFIGSSVERLRIANAVQIGLEHDAECTVWTQGVFELSQYTLTSLMEQLTRSDFGLFILAPDDFTTMRDEAKQTVRDNVIFELGLFVGQLGKDRCFIVTPRGTDFHLPTDLLGLTPAMFDPNREDGNLQAALGPACSMIREAIAKLGPFTSSRLTDEQTRKLHETIRDFERTMASDQLIILYENGWPLVRQQAFSFRNFFDDYTTVRSLLERIPPEPGLKGLMVLARDPMNPAAAYLLAALNGAGINAELKKSPADFYRSSVVLFVGRHG